jgi:hypothetical protein
MSKQKYYVYSARTTEQGLALLNKTKGDRSWDAFISEAVSEHYGLDIAIIALPLTVVQTAVYWAFFLVF